MNCLVQVKFRLARPGLMRDFAGEWRVLPFTQAMLDAQAGAKPAKGGAPWSGLVSSMHSCEWLQLLWVQTP